MEDNQTSETPSPPQDLAKDAPKGVANEAHPEAAPLSEVPSPASPPVPPIPAPPPPAPMSLEGILFRSLVGFLVLFLLAWFAYRFAGFGKTAVAPFEGMRVGSANYVEISLIREDFQNLACASDLEVGGLRCGFRDQGTPWPGLSEAHTIRQYNTIKNELFMAAGLWAQPVMQGQLPTERFSVVCEFHSVGALKNPKVRWSPTGAFQPAGRTLVVGRLAHCVIPQ